MNKRVSLTIALVLTVGCVMAPAPKTPTPRVTSTPLASPPPVQTASPNQSPAPAPITIQPTICDKRQPLYIGKVRQEMANWRAAHPFLFEGEMLVWCTDGHPEYTCPISQDVYLKGVAKGLEKYRLQGILDGDSGDLIIADANTPVGKGFSESYHPLSSWDDLNQSGRLVQGNIGYLGYCEPRWLGYK